MAHTGSNIDIPVTSLSSRAAYDDLAFAFCHQTHKNSYLHVTGCASDSRKRASQCTSGQITECIQTGATSISRIGIHILSWGCAEEWPGAGARPVPALWEGGDECLGVFRTPEKANGRQRQQENGRKSERRCLPTIRFPMLFEGK